MKPLLVSSRRARWAVPAGAVAVVAAVTAGSMVSTAAASPALPARTPSQLLAALAGQAGSPPPMSGTVTESADLGIPQLPGMASPSSALSMLAGSHTINFSYGGPAKLRLALPVPLGETDVVRNGSTAWIWQSSTDSVRKITLPPRAAGGTGLPAPGTTPGTGTAVPLTPQQAAQQLLAAVGPTTSVRTGPSTSIAGEDAYQLIIAPRDHRSLVGQVIVALDAAHPGVVLSVQVFARGAGTAAFSTAFQTVSFAGPPAATFDFTPPRGATVHTVTPTSTATTPGGTAASPTAAGAKLIGSHWLTVAVLPASVLSGLSGGNAAGALGQAAQSAAAGPGAGAGGGGGSISGAAILAGLLKSARHVSGPWGSGQLIQTSLISALITNGHVLIGAVDQSVLENAVAQAG
jgi:outer membrane lipoprotein-sorting protein